MKQKTKKEIEKDIFKKMKAIGREEYGFQPTKIVQSKKKYNRNKMKGKINLEDVM